MSDPDLLQQYVRTSSQEAFAQLVDRYVHLVYSAARRQVRSPHLAEEVTQSVFIALSRQAAKLRPTQPLAAWLFVVTRRTAIDVVRHETRRQAREQTAAEIAAMKTPSDTWAQIKEVIDEAIAALNDAERSALLLRFFENRSLREVGASLGLSEDTAQKRVSRALERLRSLLLRRGIAVSAAGLATDLSAHAIEAAPAALGATITSAASLAFTAAAPIATGTVHALSSTLAQKTIAAAVAIAVVGAVIYEATAYARQRGELAALPAQAAESRLALARLGKENDDAAMRLQSARAELARIAKVQTPDDREWETAIEAWLARIDRLKQLAAERSDLNIPELAALSEADWFTIAKTVKLETEEQIQSTFTSLHKTAREVLARLLSRALDRYAAANDLLLPPDAARLAPLMERPLPPAIFERFELLQHGAQSAVPRDEWILAERAELTPRHNTRIFVTTREFGAEELDSISDRELRRTLREYSAAHGGTLPARADELIGYFKNPRPSAVREFLARPPSDFTRDKLTELLRK